jgi:hypothetical protein
LGRKIKIEGMLLYPITPIERPNDSSVTYTFSDLKKGLIIRGLNLT